jgi:hypothetical protein
MWVTWQWFRGVMMPSIIVAWVTWQFDTWRDGSITFRGVNDIASDAWREFSTKYCNEGNMADGYVAWRHI